MKKITVTVSEALWAEVEQVALQQRALELPTNAQIVERALREMVARARLKNAWQAKKGVSDAQ